MKYKSFFGLLTAMFMLIVIPVSAQDYLKIYFKDGHTERHFMHLVENISTTKYDLEGNLHSEYQMQQVVMADTTYSYYIADIDSMAFRKFNEEQVRERVELVQASLDAIIKECSTAEDLSSHLDEIKNMEGVEEACIDGSDLFVQIRDWFEISYITRPLVDFTTSSTPKKLNKQEIKKLLPTNKDGSQMKATLAFQFEEDPRFNKKEIKFDDLCDEFRQMGYELNIYKGEEVDFLFYYKNIFESNIVFVNTHGLLGPINHKHSLFTGIEVNPFAVIGKEIDEIFGFFCPNIDLDDISFTWCKYGENEESTKCYWIVREDFIQKSPYRFTGSSPHIVHIGSCENLSGNGVLTRSDGLSCYGDDSFAKVFFNKGADVFLGYNGSAGYTTEAAKQFWGIMLHGASIEQAFKEMDSHYKYEEDVEKAYFVDLYYSNLNFNNPRGFFIVNTHTVEQTNEEFTAQYNNNGEIELNGKTARYSFERDGLSYGFVISTEPDVSQLNNNELLKSFNAQFSGSEFGEVVFSAKFTPTPGQTYYYRACTYDGLHTNWGEERSFTITTPTQSTDGLVAYYPFNGNANDMSGNNNHGSIIGNVQLTTDRHGNHNSAYYFPGQPFNYISVPDNESLHCSTFTLNAWVYSNSEGYANGYLINKGRDIEDGSYRLCVTGVGAQNDYYGVNGAGSGTEPETNVWHMVTGTVEGNKAKFYIDGVLIDEKTLSRPFVYYNSEPLTLGMHYYSNVPSFWAYPLLGVLDDVRIYNRVLSHSEILTLLNE